MFPSLLEKEWIFLQIKLSMNPPVESFWEGASFFWTLKGLFLGQKGRKVHDGIYDSRNTWAFLSRIIVFNQGILEEGFHRSFSLSLKRNAKSFSKTIFCRMRTIVTLKQKARWERGFFWWSWSCRMGCFSLLGGPTVYILFLLHKHHPTGPSLAEPQDSTPEFPPLEIRACFKFPAFHVFFSTG